MISRGSASPAIGFWNNARVCTRETLDLVYEMDRRGLFAFLVPSIFTPLHDTRMEHQTGVRTRQLSPLQGQLMMKCWKHNLRPDQYSW